MNMRSKVMVVTIGLVLSLTGVCLGDEGHDTGLVHTLTCLECLGERETLTDDWFGLGEQLAEAGVTVALSNTQVYQVNLQGAMSTHRHAGRYTGSYDLEVELDLERLLGLSGAILYAHAEESASAAEELNAQAEALSGMVQELMVLVGGSSATRKQATDTQTDAGLSASDTAWHEISTPGQTSTPQPQTQTQTPKPQTQTKAPQEALPLDDSELSSF